MLPVHYQKCVEWSKTLATDYAGVCTGICVICG